MLVVGITVSVMRHAFADRAHINHRSSTAPPRRHEIRFKKMGPGQEVPHDGPVKEVILDLDLLLLVIIVKQGRDIGNSGLVPDIPAGGWFRGQSHNERG